MIDRRSFLSLAGASSLAIPRSADAPASHRHRIVFGSNLEVWSRFNAAMPSGLHRAVRVYYDFDHIPATWPHSSGKAWVTLSLLPASHIEDLLSGELDARLKALIATAPAHSQLTFYHENEPGNPLLYPRSICNATTAVAIQKHGHRLCAGSKVKFGVIICAPAGQIAHWMAPKLDWYGYDRYLVPRYLNTDGTLNVAKLYAQMDNDYDVFRHLSGLKWPQMGFPETNAPHDRNRAHWFTALAEWGADHNCRRIISRWNGGQGLSGPWPPSRAVIRRLRYLSEVYR